MRISLRLAWVIVLVILVLSGALKAFAFGYGFEVFDITAASLAAFVLLAILANRHLISRLRAVPRAWSEAALWLTVSALAYSATAVYTASDSYVYVKLALLWASLLYYLCALAVHPGDLARTLRLLMGGTVILLIGYFPIAEDLAMRRGGFAQAEALLSLYLVLGYICGLCVIIAASGYGNLSKPWSVLIGLFFLLSLLGTGARGPLMALLVSAGVAWLMKLLSKPRSLGARLVAMVAGVSLVVTGLFLLITVGSDPSGGDQFLLNRSATRILAFADMSSSRSFVERFDHLAFVAERFQDAPQRLLGGFGIASYGITRYGVDAPAHPHNIVLESLYEGGLLSLLPLVLFFGVAAKGLVRGHGAVGLALWTYFVLNAMKSSSIVEQRILIIGVSLFLACAPRQNPRQFHEQA